MALFIETKALKPSVCNALEDPASKRFFRLFIVDAGASFDVLKEDHLLVSERLNVCPAPNHMEAHTASGELRFDRVTTALR